MQGLPQIGDILDNTYRIEKLIGTGGFGAVYLARQLSMDREVALKILVANAMDVDEMIQRFRREVMACRNLGHPNTIRIYDFRDRPDGVLYYTMEYVNGPTLKDVIKDEGPLAPRRVAYILKQICKSLAEAHSFGIIHRDLKPANIMLADIAGETDFVKVVDFGIAKIVDDGEDRDQLTNAGVLVGTLNYMSPEQIQGGEVGPASDLYALGLIAIEMLMGRSVFEGTGRWEVLHRQISDDPVDIPEEVLGSALADVLKRALNKQATERFSKAEEMLAALNAIPSLQDQPLVDRIIEPDAPLSAPVSLPVIDAIPVESEPPLPEAVRPASPLPEPVSEPVPVSEPAVPEPEPQPASPAEVDVLAQTAAMEPLRARIAADPTPVPGSASSLASPSTPHSDLPEPVAPRPSIAPAQPYNAPTLGAPEHGVADADDFAPTDTDMGPAPNSNKNLVAVAGLLLALIAVVLVAVIAVSIGKDDPDTQDDSEATVTTIDEPADPAPIDPPEEPELQPDEVEPEQPDEPVALKTIRLETGDVRAQVFDGETLIGTTPMRFPVGAEKVFTLRADGHEEATVALSNQSEDTVVELTRIAGSRTTTKTTTKTSNDGWIDVKTEPKKTQTSNKKTKKTKKAEPKKTEPKNVVPVF